MNNLHESSSAYEFKKESEDGTVFYILLPIKRLNETLKVLNTSFYPFENVSICTKVAQNLNAVTELNELSREAIKDGISLVALDKSTDSIIGLAINKIQKKGTTPSFFEKFVHTQCKEKESIGLIDLMIKCDASVDVFEIYEAKKVMEIMFLTVVPEHRQRNIGLDLVKSSVELANRLFINFKGPQAVVSLFTSRYSQRIGENLLFDELKMIPYTDFEYNGVPYSEIIPHEHSGIKIMGKKCGEQTVLDDESQD